MVLGSSPVAVMTEHINHNKTSSEHLEAIDNRIAEKKSCDYLDK